jgi:hypothetical protein
MPFYGMVFAQVFCQIHFMCFGKSTLSSHEVHIAILLFCHVDFPVLPTPLLPFCKVHIAKFSTEDRQVQLSIPKLPTRHWYFVLWLFCQIAQPTSPYGLPKIEAAHKFQNFWAVQGLNVFQVFLHRLPRHLSFSLSLILKKKPRQYREGYNI